MTCTTDFDRGKYDYTGEGQQYLSMIDPPTRQRGRLT
jgi:hypothetical protein